MNHLIRNLFLMGLLSVSSLANASLAHASYVQVPVGQSPKDIFGTDQCAQVDPDCIPKVADLCYRHTNNGYDPCYQRALTSLGCQTLGFADCVQKTSDYCYNHTTNDSSHCFDQAMTACKSTR